MPRLRPAPNEDKEEPVVAAAEPEVEVLAEPEIEVEIGEPEVQQDGATLALKKQIEDLRKSEQIHKDRADLFAREREEALERARQREAQIQRVTKEAQNYEADAISSALAAAQAELAKARMDIKNAIDAGDSDAQSQALERQAIAASNLTRLQEGKAAAEERAKEPVQPAGVDVIDTWGMPKITSDWLKNRRHLLDDPVQVNALRYWQDQAKKEGITPHTKEFLDYMEVKLGERPEPEVEVEAEPAPKPKGIRMSAPVSREVPNNSGKRPANGKVTLSPAEVEAARISGITPEEYAKQKIRKAEMVASGEYGEQR